MTNSPVRIPEKRDLTSPVVLGDKQEFAINRLRGVPIRPNCIGHPFIMFFRALRRHTLLGVDLHQYMHKINGLASWLEKTEIIMPD